jgi:hypothetical protein
MMAAVRASYILQHPGMDCTRYRTHLLRIMLIIAITNEVPVYLLPI